MFSADGSSSAVAPATETAGSEPAPGGESATAEENAEEPPQHLDEDDLLQLAQKAEEQYEAEQIDAQRLQEAEALAAMATSQQQQAVDADTLATSSTAAAVDEAATTSEQQLMTTSDPSQAVPAGGGVPMVGEDGQSIDPNSQTLVFQTDDGLILIRQPDGNFQVQSTTGAPINMDTVRALISQLQFT